MQSPFFRAKVTSLEGAHLGRDSIITIIDLKCVTLDAIRNITLPQMSYAWDLVLLEFWHFMFTIFGVMRMPLRPKVQYLFGARQKSPN